MKFKNFTPHPVNLFDETGETIIRRFQPEEHAARVNEKIKHREPIDRVPVVWKMMTGVKGLPQAKSGVTLIVSIEVLNASNRIDLVAPDTGPGSAVRNEVGLILGVRRFMI